MIETDFDQENLEATTYPYVVLLSLKRLLNSGLEDSRPINPDSFQDQLPIFKWFWKENTLSLHFICHHRLNIGKFFYEMIHRWLLPGQRLEVAFFLSSDFKFQTHPNELYTLAEMSLRIEDHWNITDIEHNLKIIEVEVRLGMVSVYHASRLLEMHLLTVQEKNGIIQEKISKLIQRNPDEIDYDIFGELQHFMVMSKEEFKTSRDPHHLSRLIVLFYLFRKSIERSREKQPQKRHIRLKIGLVDLEMPWGTKKVLGVCIGLNLLRPSEMFEENHLLRALQNSSCNVMSVKESFFVNEGINDNIHTLYLEIEKVDGHEFTPEEIHYLRKFLPEELKQFIELPLNSVFMPRNEEEVIRYIITLSGQLRYVKDLPQVVLVFDEQKEGDIYFTVIIVRILFSNTLSVESLFKKSTTFLSYFPDRIKKIGMLRKKYPKEATVFRVKLSCLSFLRDDHRVDLFKARQAIVLELQHILGEIRDYTGGMIAKQIELLQSLQTLVGTNDRISQRLLDVFFHSIYPIEARSVILPQYLKIFFDLWKQLIEGKESPWAFKNDATALYIIGRQGILKEIDLGEYIEMQLIIIRPEFEEKFLGYLFFSQDFLERQIFLSKLQLTYNFEKLVHLS